MLSAVRVFQWRVDLVGEDVFGERFADRQIETCEQRVLSARLRSTGAGWHDSEAVALRYPVMPVARRLLCRHAGASGAIRWTPTVSPFLSGEPTLGAMHLA
jgi:hypothetical protein